MTESCVVVGWNVYGVGKGMASGTVPIGGLSCWNGGWVVASVFVVNSGRGG